MIISEQCTDSETEPKRLLTVEWKCYWSILISDWVTRYELYMKVLLVWKWCLVIMLLSVYNSMFLILIIKHVRWLLNAYVCVYVYVYMWRYYSHWVCDSRLATNILQGKIRLVQVFVTLYTVNQPTCQPSDLCTSFCTVGLFCEGSTQDSSTVIFLEIVL